MIKVLLYSYYDTTAGWVAHLNPKPSTLNGLRVEGAPREAKRPPVASTSRHRSLTFQRLSQMNEGCVGFRVQGLGFRVLRCRESSSNWLMFRVSKFKRLPFKGFACIKGCRFSHI